MRRVSCYDLMKMFSCITGLLLGNPRAILPMWRQCKVPVMSQPIISMTMTMNIYYILSYCFIQNILTISLLLFCCECNHRCCWIGMIYLLISSALQGFLYSPNGRSSYRKISWRLDAVRFGFRLFKSLWNLTGSSAAALPSCQSNLRVIQSL